MNMLLDKAVFMHWEHLKLDEALCSPRVIVVIFNFTLTTVKCTFSKKLSLIECDWIIKNIIEV